MSLEKAVEASAHTTRGVLLKQPDKHALTNAQYTGKLSLVRRNLFKPDAKPHALLDCVSSKPAVAPTPRGVRTGWITTVLRLATLLTILALPAVGQNIDALDVQLYKGTLCSQGSSGGPSPVSGSPYFFQAVLGPPLASRVSAVTVRTPALVTHSMTLGASMNFVFNNGAASQSALDGNYGNGSYLVQYTGLDDGQVSVSVSLGTDDFPPAPAVANVLAAQSVEGTNDFVVSFAPGTNANDYVQLLVVDSGGNLVFQTQPIYSSAGLSATNSGIVIPADTLSPGAIYTALLQFLRLTTLSQAALPFEQAGFVSETTFTIQTQGASSGYVDALDIQLYKGKTFTQGTNGAPSASTNQPYVFQAILGPTLASQVSAVSVETPALATDPMLLNAGTNFVFTGAANSQSNLDSAYGAGNYIVRYTGLDDGPVSVPLSLSPDDFPPTPAVSNVVAAQSVSATNDFLVAFAPDTNANDYVQLFVLDLTGRPVFQIEPVYYSAGLSATNSGIPIAANTLARGSNYVAVLQFLRLGTLSVAATPFTQVGFFAQTTFSIQTQSTNTGGGPTNAPPAPLAPPIFLGSHLSLTITNGSGSFGSSGTYQLFASPAGSNYVVLGPTGQGLSSGTYSYTATTTNVATLTLEDSRLTGSVSLQIVFQTGGAGSYFITSASGSQSGAFSSVSSSVGSSATVTPAHLFLPAVSNSVFQAYLSGQAGATYKLEASTNLSTWSILSSFTLTDLSTNVSDPSAAPCRFYRARLDSVAYAPASPAGLAFEMSVDAGALPFATNGIFQWAAATNGGGYTIVGQFGATTGGGIYSYSTDGANTALLNYVDSSSSIAYGATLVFTLPASGYFYATNSSGVGFQSGRFTVVPGPALFLGNVGFVADAARGVSGTFRGDGTPLTLSVTDGAGFVWTLAVPRDALLTPATLTMTPFSAINTNQSALPVSSGVQLGPDGMHFAGAVTLMVQAPSPLGPHASLLLGSGDGSGLFLVPTTNSAATYSTTLFHFSSGVVSDPSQDQLAAVAAQAKAAFEAADQAVQAMTRAAVPPPEPPDYEFNCSHSNPAADAAINTYIASLFDKETAANNALLSAGRMATMATGDPYFDATALADAEKLTRTAVFRKIEALLQSWSGTPLKWQAVATTALAQSSADSHMGGAGYQGVYDTLATWLSGNVMERYWNKLRKEHDYTMEKVLVSLDQQDQLLGAPGDPNIVQRLSDAYRFGLTITFQLGGNLQTAAASESAQGNVTLGGTADSIFPLRGTNTVTFTEGSLGGQVSLKLPLSYPQRAFLEIDTCSSLSARLYLGIPAAQLDGTPVVETWLPSVGQSFQEALLEPIFGVAFRGAQLNPPKYGCLYMFPVPLENLQAQPVSLQFNGPSDLLGGVTLSISLTLDHKPQ